MSTALKATGEGGKEGTFVDKRSKDLAKPLRSIGVDMTFFPLFFLVGFLRACPCAYIYMSDQLTSTCEKVGTTAI